MDRRTRTSFLEGLLTNEEQGHLPVYKRGGATSKGLDSACLLAIDADGGARPMG